MVSPGKRRGKARKRAGGATGVAVVGSGRERKAGARGAVKVTPVTGMAGALQAAASAGRRGPKPAAPVLPARAAEEISRRRAVASRAEPIGRPVKTVPVGRGAQDGGAARAGGGGEGARAGSAFRGGSLPGLANQLSGSGGGGVRAGGGRAGVTRLDPGEVAAGAASRGSDAPALPVPIASFLI